MNKLKKNTFETKKSERMGIYSYFVGQNIIYFLVTLFLADYYLNSLAIPAGIVATIILVARIWDAVNDPMLSILVEKVNLKGGKFKPWIKSVAILIPIITVALYGFTDMLNTLPLTGRIAYAAITYIVWGMLYTISDAPAFALTTVMTSDINERNTIISFSRFSAMVGILIVNIAAPIILAKTDNRYFIVALVFSLIAFVLLLQINRTKERIRSEKKSASLKEILSAIFQNKYVITYVLVAVAVNGFNFALTIMPMIAQDVFGDKSLMSLISLTTIFPMLIIAPFMPALVRRYGKVAIFRVTLIGLIIISAIIYFIGYNNISIFMVLNIIRGFLTAPTMVLGSLFFADAIEYDYYTKGKRFEAAVFSAQTFSSKAISALSGALGVSLLGVVGYKESMAGEVIVQSVATIDGIWKIYNIGLIVGSLIGLIIFVKFYDLTESKLLTLKDKSTIKGVQ